MQTFIVPNSGLIRAVCNSDGSLIVEHSGAGEVEVVIDRVCRGGRALWNSSHRNWVVSEKYAKAVLADLETVAVPFVRPLLSTVPASSTLLESKPEQSVLLLERKRRRR